MRFAARKFNKKRPVEARQESVKNTHTHTHTNAHGRRETEPERLGELCSVMIGGAGPILLIKKRMDTNAGGMGRRGGMPGLVSRDDDEAFEKLRSGCKVQEPHQRDELDPNFQNTERGIRSGYRRGGYWWSLRAGCDQPDRAWPWLLDDWLEGFCITSKPRTAIGTRPRFGACSECRPTEGKEEVFSTCRRSQVPSVRTNLPSLPRTLKERRTCRIPPDGSWTGVAMQRSVVDDGWWLFVDSHSGTCIHSRYCAHRVWPLMRERRPVADVSQENRSAIGSSPPFESRISR